MAQRSISTPSNQLDGAPDYRRVLPLIVAAVALLGFMAAPWPLSEKAHAVLHGLCAQTPSHTFRPGGHPLPFDARMTGIYSALSFTLAVVAVRTRFRFAALPSWPVLMSLGLAVTAMAVDGFNSLFLDMGMWHPYTPQNWLRLVTGAGAGVALGATVSFLIASTVWARPDERTRVFTGRDVMITAVCWLPFAGLIMSGWGIAYVPLTMFLVISAVLTLCIIAYLMLVLTRQTNNRHTAFADIGSEGAVGVLLGLVAIALLACLRFALEYWLGIPTPK